MGSGMALAFAGAGIPVALVSRRRSTLDRALAHAREAAQLLARHDAASRAEGVLERIQTTTDLDDVDVAADLVVESVVEDLHVKRDLLRAVEARVDPSTVLTTNTSSLPLEALQEVLHRPERFAGYHWFNPPELVRLVEVVRAPRTSEDTARQLVAWSEGIGKTPVLVRKGVQGFVANRLQYALLREAYALVERGVCTVEDVDRVVTAGLGPRWAAVGPFRSMDLAGLDVHQEVVRHLFPRLSNRRGVPLLLRRLVTGGALGAKSGRGLRGLYRSDTIRALGERRARVLLTLAPVPPDDR
jgi:3-hydroxybutyryl-CoA dehydrogenase